MPSFGINAETGKALTGLDHVKQSLGKILATRIGTRVMKREFGSQVPDLVDRPVNGDLKISVFAATADAIVKWEPRFRLSRMALSQVYTDGRIVIDLQGTYYPRGHLGDYTSGEDVVFPLQLR